MIHTFGNNFPTFPRTVPIPTRPRLTRADLIAELENNGWKCRIAHTDNGPELLIFTPFEIICPIHFFPDEDHAGCLVMIYDKYSQFMIHWGQVGTG